MKVYLALSTLVTTTAWLAYGSFFGSHPHLNQYDYSVTKRDNFCGGPHHLPCPSTEPCCNNGTCHTTSMQSCPIALGCDERHSAPNACFPLPGCQSFKDNFKHANLLVPKQVFTGDPNQAYWTSDFHHIAPYVKIDQKHHNLQMRVRRDMVKTRSGGGFGARVSSTRWSKYGTFSVKLKSASTGPGIVTAIVLINPANGDEISFELTGRDPKSVYTNYYHRLPKPKKQTDEHNDDDHNGHHNNNGNNNNNNGNNNNGNGHIDHSNDKAENNGSENHGASSQDHAHENGEHSSTSSPPGHTDEHHNHHHLPPPPARVELGPLLPHEEQHTLKKDSTTHFLTYKLEWTEKLIRWSVEGKVLRTVHVEKLTDTYTNIPANAMQFQIMVWDGGYAPETADWCGGKTDYGADNLDEYVATVQWVDIHCQNGKDGSKPWPGPEAMKRIKVADQQAKMEEQRRREYEAEAEREHRRRMGLDTDRRIGWLDAMMGPVVRFLDMAVLTLIKWTFVVLAIVCVGAYVTDPRHAHSRNYKHHPKLAKLQ
ncbi:hypothetical protein DFQ26_003582 [Actinomortierella ambigua]|nr:hypothetical protein DFQ26_003582 [Actinomortierella ambigua]